MQHRLPLLITGVAGVSGYNALEFFRGKYGDSVIGQRREDLWPLRGEGIIGCNIDDYDGLKRLIEQHEIKAILSCGGSCALKSCELDPTMAHRVNVAGINNLLNVIEGTDIRLVHLSIDLVFSGTRGGNHHESEEADPVTVYGQMMVTAEQLVMQRRPDACVLRISLPMGVSFNGHAGAIDWIQARFMQNKPATLYFDEVRTPTYTDCLNRALESVIESDLQGLFHSGGPRQLSLYEIAQIVNRVGGYAPELLNGCYRIQAGDMPPRAGNVAMDSMKLENAIGRSPFDPWPIASEFVPTHRDWHFTRDTFAGSADLLREVLYLNPRHQMDSTYATYVP